MMLVLIFNSKYSNKSRPTAYNSILYSGNYSTINNDDDDNNNMMMMTLILWWVVDYNV